MIKSLLILLLKSISALEVDIWVSPTSTNTQAVLSLDVDGEIPFNGYLQIIGPTSFEDTTCELIGS